jgi:hypothetical protein
LKNFIEKTSTWAGNISSISKLLIGLFFLIFTIGTEWYQIQVNLKTNIKQEEDIKDSKSYAEKIFNELSQNIKKENKLQQEKFNETNKRFIENLKEFNKYKETQENKLLQSRERISFLEGRLHSIK